MRSKCFFWILSILPVFNCSELQAQVRDCSMHKGTLLMPPLYNNVENTRSDSFDILKYNINLEIGNSVSKSIKGNTIIKFAPKVNNQSSIRLDLLKLVVDSVKEGASLLSYNYNDTILKVNFLISKNIVDTSAITVYYNGQPQKDATWGGFYFDNDGGNEYAYNLGVGFASQPHNFGRVWFPCFDNFVERSKYEFSITSDSARRAFCNGILTADVLSGEKRTRKWKMEQEIPTYLVGIALAKYKQVNWSINTLSGQKPITLVAVAGDTTGMKTGFVNLSNCINTFEDKFGLYRWSRFGYCLVPFNGGAMEHATNIAYPRAAMGNLAYEANLMAHELAHHWWGNNITCSTPEDMWINEGMATYSGYLFTENTYGPAQYLSAVKSEHDKLLHFLHLKEGGFRAISGVPHHLTYGQHVYKKGADVAHTLRSYMGDAKFFDAIKYTMEQNKFKHINSLELRDLFQTSSGIGLNNFFDHWVLAGGWPHFSIDSVKYHQIGQDNFNAVVSIKQKLFGAPSLYSNVPLELSFFKADRTRTTQKLMMSGSTGSFTLNLPFNPIYCALNFDSKINDATSFESQNIKTPGNYSWPLGKVYTMVQSAGTDSSLLRIIHNYVKPDPFKNNPQQHKLSDQHYWKVEGILSEGFHSKARFSYNGNKTLGGTYSYLDTLLTVVNGDSLRLFYRANAADDWRLVMNIFKFQSGTRDGFIEIDSLLLGEYCFGNSTDTTNVVGLKSNVTNKSQVKMFPNPAANILKIEMKKAYKLPLVMNLLDMEGKLLLEKSLTEQAFSLDVSAYPRGKYILMLRGENQILYCDKLLLN